MRAIDGIARLMGLDRERLSGGDIDSLQVNALYQAFNPAALKWQQDKYRKGLFRQFRIRPGF